MKEIIIYKRSSANPSKITHKAENSISNAFMNAKGYMKYVHKYGLHFTPELSEYASSLMENANKTKHSWNTSQVQKILNNLGLEIPNNYTIGDIIYMANQGYADYYPNVLRDENACVQYSYMTANDPDGYEGMIFQRWSADILGKSLDIPWEKFI